MTREAFAQYCEVPATGNLPASMILSSKTLGVLLVELTTDMSGLRPRDQELDLEYDYSSYTKEILLPPALISGS